MIALYVSIGINVLLFLIVCGCFYYLNRAGRSISEYEQFYEQTITELEDHLHYVKDLMQNNVILSNDESVQQVFRAIEAFYTMLIGYYNA